MMSNSEQEQSRHPEQSKRDFPKIMTVYSWKRHLLMAGLTGTSYAIIYEAAFSGFSIHNGLVSFGAGAGAGLAISIANRKRH